MSDTGLNGINEQVSFLSPQVPGIPAPGGGFM
jgi:hypothetical protein